MHLDIFSCKNCLTSVPHSIFKSIFFTSNQNWQKANQLAHYKINLVTKRN